MNQRKNSKCPKCKSGNVIPIHYGYIDTHDAVKRIENEEIHAGGCLISEDSKKWKCLDCNKEFGKIEFV